MTTINQMATDAKGFVLSHNGDACECSPKVVLIHKMSNSGYATSNVTKVITHNDMPSKK